MNHIFKTSVLIMECVELNWLSKHVKKIRSSQPDIPVLNWVKHQSFLVSIVKLWRPSSQDKVLSTNLTGGEPRFCTVDTWSSPQNSLILTLRYLRQSFRCHVVALIEVERFCIVTHCLCETNTIFKGENNYLDTKITKNSESSSKMNMRSCWTVFEILPMSAVICI